MQVCRICLEQFEDTECISFTQDVSNDITIEYMLSTCIPQMQLSLVTESVLCCACLNSLDFVYNFIKKCIEADAKIHSLANVEIITSLNEVYIKTDEATDTQILEVIKNDMDDQCEIVTAQICGDENLVVEPQLVSDNFSTNDFNTIQTHVKKEPLECDKCDYTTCRTYDLRRHYRGVHKQTIHVHRAISCGICGEHFNTKYLRRQHYILHADQTSHICHICGRKYSRFASLTRHIKMHNGDKQFSCEICGCKFMTRFILDSHMRTHTGEKPYLCEQCGFRTSNNSHFLYHKELHTGRKRFKCEQCNYQCLARSSLNVHLRIHNGEKRFECYYCGYKTTTLQHLKEHIRKHTGERPYACEFCPHTTSRRSHLVVHMKSHREYKHKPKRLKCRFCEFKTMILVTLNEHERMHETKVNLVANTHNVSK